MHINLNLDSEKLWTTDKYASVPAYEEWLKNKWTNTNTYKLTLTKIRNWKIITQKWTSNWIIKWDEYHCEQLQTCKYACMHTLTHTDLLMYMILP